MGAWERGSVGRRLGLEVTTNCDADVHVRSGGEVTEGTEGARGDSRSLPHRHVSQPASHGRPILRAAVQATGALPSKQGTWACQNEGLGT